MANLGKPLQLTNEQIAEAAVITDEDVDRVNAKWMAVVPSAIKNLLLAEPPDDETGS